MFPRLYAMIFAASAFAFVAPLAANAKGYQPSSVDSKAIEGQCLLAKAAKTKEQCEEKGKYWECEAKSGWRYEEVSEDGSKGSTTDRNNWCATEGVNDDSRCSCECNF
tara:strand:+ start:159 stop:482 length:324 start_codon:yes stop_codon:yes gene_type:complete